MTDQAAGVGMVMNEDILRHPGKVGNIAVGEEAATTMMTTTIKDLQAAGVEIQDVEKAEDGMEMKKDIPNQPWKVGNIVAVSAGIDTMKMMTTTRDHHATVAAAVVMRKVMTTKDLPAVVEEAETMMETIFKGLQVVVAEVHAVARAGVGLEMRKVIPKQPWKAGSIGAAEEAVIMITMTIIKDLQGVVAEARVVVKAGAGLEMRKVIPKRLWKDGSIGAEEAEIMITMTIIKDRHGVAAEARAVEKAEDGMAMKKNIPVQPGKVGEIVIDCLNLNFRKGTCGQCSMCLFFCGKHGFKDSAKYKREYKTLVGTAILTSNFL